MPAPIKTFLSYADQVALLASRGMNVGNASAAEDALKAISYYRLSGYWYPFRQKTSTGRSDSFDAGTTLADVVKLYEFDSRLRTTTFAQLTPIELTVRALLGHELGRVHETAHLQPALLNARAKGDSYTSWLDGYEKKFSGSREDFVKHHQAVYGGTLPVWAAVEILDWGGMTRLFGFSPRAVQNAVAGAFGLTAPQLESWLRELGIIRNICAHHGRLFNKVSAAPKLPTAGQYPDLEDAGPFNRTFGKLSLVQHLNKRLGSGNIRLLPAVLRSYPAVQAVPVEHTGAPADWQDLALWS